MTKSMDLTKGHITTELLRLALPIFLTSFIQVAYGFIDTFWIGQMSDEAVAAVGTASYFLWMGTSLALICKIGGNVTISQSIGAKDQQATRTYITHSMLLNMIIAVIYSLLLVTFSKQIIGFFDLGVARIEDMASLYLVIIGVSMIFYFFNPVVSAILTAFGNSLTPFIFNSIGFVFNIVLDPILIFGKMGLPALGVAGAAVATAISQVVVALCFIIYLWIRIKRGDLPYLQKLQLKNFDFKAMKRIVSIGLPAAMQSAVLAILSMIVAKFVAVWGAFAIAAQRVGVQIESISWATCEGFAVAVSTFVGQNYGAKKYNRLKKGFLVSTGIVTLVGTVATLVLFLFNRQIYEFFVSDPVTISYGIDYMMILAISQIFMCIEISSAGAFNGVSKSGIAAFIIIIITALRVPFAWLVVQMGWSINGIWWIVSLTSIGKGLVLLICFMWYMRYRLKEQNA